MGVFSCDQQLAIKSRTTHVIEKVNFKICIPNSILSSKFNLFTFTICSKRYPVILYQNLKDVQLFSTKCGEYCSNRRM